MKRKWILIAIFDWIILKIVLINMAVSFSHRYHKETFNNSILARGLLYRRSRKGLLPDFIFNNSSISLVHIHKSRAIQCQL